MEPFGDKFNLKRQKLQNWSSESKSGHRRRTYFRVGNDPHWGLRGQTDCLAEPTVGNQAKHQDSYYATSASLN